MILQAEHGCQASTLAALTVISTGADLGSAVIAGTGALSGQLHGGAIQQSYINLLNLNTVDEAKKWVKDKIEENYKFPGFGHRIYKTHDPRVKIIEPYAEKLLKNKGDNLLWDKYVVVRDEMEDKLGKKGVYVNIFGVIGLVYHALGLPIGSFPIVFALSTQCGWMAHCLEYVSEGKMLEPGAIYIG
jgi:citrate synthase